MATFNRKESGWRKDYMEEPTFAAAGKRWRVEFGEELAILQSTGLPRFTEVVAESFEIKNFRTGLIKLPSKLAGLGL